MRAQGNEFSLVRARSILGRDELLLAPYLLATSNLADERELIPTGS